MILFFVVSPSVFVLRVEGEKEREEKSAEGPFCYSSRFFAPKWRKSLLIVRNGEIES